jgi:hypothetical protein
LIEFNRGLARLDLPDFELASRNDVDALGAFLEANGIYFTDPDGMKLEAMVYKPPPKKRRAGKR